MNTIKTVAVGLYLLAFLACVPTPHMTKSQLLICTEPQPDEHQVVQEYGVPKSIELLPGAPMPDFSEPSYLWHYFSWRGTDMLFAFSWDGRLIWQSGYTPPSPKPR